MRQGRITAEVISCPGTLGNARFFALQLNVDGFASPFVLTLTLSAIGYRALSEQADPASVFGALADALNDSGIAIDMKTRHDRARKEETHA